MSWVVNFWRSSIGKKVVMAVTGIIMIGFLISHVASNLLIFQDPAHLDSYAEMLRSLGPLLWLARAILLASLILHIVAATQLTLRDRAARPIAYGRRDPQVSTIASRTMRWGGVLLLAFIILHLLHFTFGTIHSDFRPGEVGRNVIVAFASPVVVLLYVFAMIWLGLHLYHGAWSSMRTLGLFKPSDDPLKRRISATLAILIYGGFTIIPIGVFLGLVRR